MSDQTKKMIHLRDLRQRAQSRLNRQPPSQGIGEGTTAALNVLHKLASSPESAGQALALIGQTLEAVSRAFFALPADKFSTATGQHTNAVYGFTSMLINTLRDEKPTHVGVAFDVSRRTFRSEEYPEYKATRSATPSAARSSCSPWG